MVVGGGVSGRTGCSQRMVYQPGATLHREVKHAHIQ